MPWTAGAAASIVRSTVPNSTRVYCSTSTCAALNTSTSGTAGVARRWIGRRQGAGWLLVAPNTSQMINFEELGQRRGPSTRRCPGGGPTGAVGGCVALPGCASSVWLTSRHYGTHSVFLIF